MTPAPDRPDKNPAGCQRSAATDDDSQAYPDRVATELRTRDKNLQYDKIACSGDTSNQLLTKQVNKANTLLGDKSAVATITIGANDFEFSSVETYKRAFTPSRKGEHDAFVKNAGENLQKNLKEALIILGRDRPARRLVVTQYFNPFNAKSVVFQAAADQFLGTFACGSTFTDSNDDLLKLCKEIIDQVFNHLNNSIKSAVEGYENARKEAEKAAGVHWASSRLVSDVAEKFKGHESPKLKCGSADPTEANSWIQFPAEPLSAANIPLTGNDCFHPNRAGHLNLSTLVNARLGK